MCDSCASIDTLVHKSKRERDPLKERIMRVLLKDNCKIQHPDAVAVFEDMIVWPSGTLWVVGRCE